MAALPLMTTQVPGLDSVLQQLAANTPPPPPSWWPLALGYWLILLVVTVVIALAIFFWQRNRDWRAVQRQLKQIQQLPSALEQSQQTHALLRWVRAHKCHGPAKLNETQFAQLVQQTLSIEDCLWLNSHYRSDCIAPDWHDVQQLLRHWRKEAKR